MRYLKATVCIAGGPRYSAFIEEERYRLYGSVYPLFPKSEAMRILRELNSIPDGFTKMNYDPSDDRFEYCDFAAKEIIAFDTEDVETDEGPKHLYEIGTYSWQWELADGTPVARASRQCKPKSKRGSFIPILRRR